MLQCPGFLSLLDGNDGNRYGCGERGRDPQEGNAPPYDDWGRVDAPVVLRQDEMAWIGQGPLSDRTQEHLVTSDKGIMLYHNLLLSNMETVERGDDPMGVVRDSAKNFPMIDVRHEGTARAPFALAGAARR